MKLFNKNLLIIIFSIILCLPSLAVAQTLIDKIIVIVNDDVITENDLEKRIARIKATNEVATIDQSIRDRILESMVEELVQIQTALRVGIKVSEAEVDQLVQRFLSQRKTTETEFSAKLAEFGLGFNDLREAMWTNSMMRKLIRSDAVRSVKVSDEEVETFAKAYNIKAENPEYDVSFLFVKSPAEVNEQQQKELLDTIQSLQNQTQSSDLDQLASALAAVQINSEKKDLGFNLPDKLPSIFASTLAKMTVGNLSSAFKTSSGIYVLKLNNLRGNLTKTEKRKAQHILIKAETPLEVQKAQQTLDRLLVQMEAGVKFENIAKFYSDDSGSAANGGDLGWMKKGETVPKFEAKLFSMNEGEISEPVVTQYGVHVIKLNEISEVADPNERKRVLAYNNLMTQKVDQYFPTFLSKLMGKSYIKYF